MSQKTTKYLLQNHIQYYKKLNMSNFFSWIPRPFKMLQRYLDVEQQWQEFKRLLKPHKFKIYFVIVITTYPLYSPYLKRTYHEGVRTLTTQAHQNLQPSSSFYVILQNFLKNVIDDVFHDPLILHETVQFVQGVIKQDQFMDDLLGLLLSAVKQQRFLNQIKVQLKNIILDQVKDPQIQSQTLKIVQKVIKSPQVKQSLQKLLKEVFTSQQTLQILINLLKNAITHKQCKQALGQAVNYAVRQLLVDEQTLNQLKIFVFFLLRKFENDAQIKGMMDILFAKGLGIGKKKKEDPQLDKLLKSTSVKKTDTL